MKKKFLVLGILTMQLTIAGHAQEAGTSRWGANDQIGTLNMMTDQSRLDALKSIDKGKLYDLSVEYFIGMPSFHMMGDPKYQYWLTHTPQGTVVDNPNWQGEDMNKKVSYTSDAISMSTHMGTHIDALNHFGLNGKIWNGYEEPTYLGDKGWKKSGAETIPPIVSRGVLIDLAGYKGKDVLDKNYRISADDLKGALQKQNTGLKPGDVVLIRTGQGAYFKDANKYVDQYPGLSLAAARWLVEDQKVMTIGADNLGLEAFPSEEKGNWVPVHSYLLTEKGVMFIEKMFLEELAVDKVYEFAFISASLKLQGASGSPVRPIALPYNSR